MALKKSQLYSSLWQSCDELRGGMDASQYKDYVLTLLFMKYVSDNAADRPDALIEVPEGAGFADMVRLKGDKEIGDKINKIIGRLAEANDLKGVIDQVDFNDEGDDLLGDAYEYLIRHFATTRTPTNGELLSRVSLLVPPLDEQLAIATVLSSIDAETTALERRSDTIRAIKQGMMPQLLTGRVRLVKPQALEAPA